MVLIQWQLLGISIISRPILTSLQLPYLEGLSMVLIHSRTVVRQIHIFTMQYPLQWLHQEVSSGLFFHCSLCLWLPTSILCFLLVEASALWVNPSSMSMVIIAIMAGSLTSLHHYIIHHSLKQKANARLRFFWIMAYDDSWVHCTRWPASYPMLFAKRLFPYLSREKPLISGGFSRTANSSFYNATLDKPAHHQLGFGFASDSVFVNRSINISANTELAMHSTHHPKQ